ncbi:MAG TPA: hypothetical protein RMH99_05860 [Sandaracinaceae bacterium LLY-WYZ-13_1]|nr:hypothetical protein [Sandaracinaceae bacterium LLY-WYZ-13_1]
MSVPWHHYAYAHAWDNDYANETRADLSCEPNRGRAANPIFILNHFLTAPAAMRSLAEMINHDPFFLERARRCEREAMQIPSFVAVDFYEIGDLFSVVDTLNGL